jgi:4-amino-4-deoxy-L-arabinose transferase-like glycosyltransferase
MIVPKFKQSSSRIKQHLGLAFLLTLYFILTAAYSNAIPFSKGPDEYINYQYILFIAQHQRLPATLAEKQQAGVKADWQPLYHLVAGLAATPISLAVPPELKVTWQPPTRQLIDLILPRATLVRTEDERPPYRGVYAVWQLGRWVSMILGAGTLLATYFLSLTLWPEQPALAAGATALLVFIPRFLFTHAVLSDDTLLGFCLALYLLLLIRLVQKSITNNGLTEGGQRSVVSGLYSLLAGLGLTAGLAIVTKYTAIPVVAGALLTLGLVARRESWPWSKLLRCGAIFVGSLGLIVGCWVGWVWWHFNQIDNLGWILGLIKPLLPGTAIDDNPTTARLTALLSGQRLADLGEAPNAGGNFLDWAQHTFATLWGVTVFGAEPHWPYLYEVILGGLALFCLMAGLGLWRGFRRMSSSDRLACSVLALHVLLFFPIPLLRFGLSGRLNDAAQGRHLLFPAGPALVVLLLLGWLAWFRPQRRGKVAVATGGLMALWAVIHLVYFWIAYPPPLPVRTTLGPSTQLAQATQIDFGNVLQLAGYQTHLLNEEKVLQVDLLWRSLAQVWEDYRTEITLVDGQGQTQLRWLSQPADGRFPVRAWEPGDWVRDTLFIPLAGLSSGDYSLQLRLIGWDNPLASAKGELLSLATVTLKTTPLFSQASLWQRGQEIANEKPTYRYRSTIPVTTAQPATVTLIGPNEQTRSPAIEGEYLHLFTVDYDWISGDYQLQVDGVDKGHLKVENFPRNFTPPAMMQPVQANFANKIELLGYDLPTRRAAAGSGVPLVLYWRGLTQLREDYTIFVQLLDSQLQRRGGYDRFPRENYNTYLWVPGEVVSDGFAVPIDDHAPAGIYTIRLGLYRRENGQAVSLPLVQDGQTLDETSVVIGPLKVGGPPAGIAKGEVSPENSVAIDLGEVIHLRGYDLRVEKAALKLKLYWQCLAQTNSDYTVFIHLLDETGRLVAQIDGPPAAGQYPTSLWDTGDLIPDSFTLPLPPELKAGTYHLGVGLYDPASGARLAVSGTADNTVLLAAINLR